MKPRNKKPLAIGAAALGCLVLGTCCCIGSGVTAYYNVPSPGNVPPPAVRAVYEENRDAMRLAGVTPGCSPMSRAVASSFLTDRSAFVTARRECGYRGTSYDMEGRAPLCSIVVPDSDTWYPERVWSNRRDSHQKQVDWARLPDGSYCVRVTIAGHVSRVDPDSDEWLRVVLHTPPGGR